MDSTTFIGLLALVGSLVVLYGLLALISVVSGLLSVGLGHVSAALSKVVDVCSLGTIRILVNGVNDKRIAISSGSVPSNAKAAQNKPAPAPQQPKENKPPQQQKGTAEKKPQDNRELHQVLLNNFADYLEGILKQMDDCGKQHHADKQQNQQHKPQDQQNPPKPQQVQQQQAQAQAAIKPDTVNKLFNRIATLEQHVQALESKGGGGMSAHNERALFQRLDKLAEQVEEIHEKLEAVDELDTAVDDLKRELGIY